MVTKNTQHDIDIDESDQMRLFLALSSFEQSPQENALCPDTALLTQLMQRKLNSKKRQLLLEHIDNCPVCYEKLIQMPVPQIQENKTVSVFALWGSMIQHIIERIQYSIHQPRYVLVPSLVIASCCLFIFITITQHSNDLEQLINNSYQIVQKQTMAHNTITLPWEQSQTAFISNENLFPETKAFAAGLMHGRNELNQSTRKESHSNIEEWGTPDETSFKELQIYFWAGQWAVMIQSLASVDSDLPQTFWDNQIITLRSLISQFSQIQSIHANRMISLLESIQKQIQSKTHEKPVIEQKQIAQKVTALIERFSPKQLELQ